MFALLLIYAAIAAFSIPRFIRKKEWRELTAFSFFYILGFVMGLLYVLDITLPSPMKALHHVISDRLGLKYPD